ncbi:Polyketide cyclase/dehydrase OS=Tsukamurella paurometabola (strain ATCC 8368 / DSM / CCUG 35730/ CIP 100753 / JCM 10117 / KCTC 9821 / NBRC 16120 / NCIMB 702349 / NCTC 13040) OX=521096 GN=Tpau_1219 PE=4 SV=1 [Tsukamurella paurometabola]|uniref:Polyketide cyclase/dehydrase n=1 Tax=Tsukamurella paurometabola (strain ATCC 8368 / DSM 20162 / CCUG 35730 / CIP 100753 / JCM 10117 / KCTC 9821 / NBRC 16120 / NCIMB 702349 / NCTC 13040) TaxID=521096 RepID=D5UW43_TSUPD|nr:SRPBCC family protein [Tsukamurella paurometabola]ADG77850.1 Polyketide cyclase/dehydrase [Tsukamurella paurometabola DSM 20162]SUP29042.1 Polyketide cyclase / dehydrase and lipid transport [Tsukamurella paurometabola]
MGAFTVERSTVIDAPAETVFGLINNFHEWRHWSPWEGLDPALHRDYSGPADGRGATYSWRGNRKAGAGRMTITDSVAGDCVDIDLDFEKPMAAHNHVRFDIRPDGEVLRVTWTMTGVTTGFFALIGKVLPMDRFVGRDFERGLAALKARAEST